MLYRLLSLFILMNVLIVNGVCEDDRGRLPNGQAYRTDSQGMQLVDYVAELEVTVDEMRRQVHGLQYELEEKEDIISALKKNGGKTPAIKEKDLLTQQAARQVLATPIGGSSNCSVNAGIERPISDSECNRLVNTYKKQIKDLNQQAATLQQTIDSNVRTIASYKAHIARLKDNQPNSVYFNESASNYDSTDTTEILASLGRLRSELEAAKRSERMALSQLKDFQDATKDEDLRAKLLAANKELDLTKEELKELKAKNKYSVAKASLSPRALAQIQTERSQLKTLYNRTRGMAAERDKRYALYRQGNRGVVRISASPLRSNRGVYLKQIPGKLAVMKTMEDASKIRRDLLDIQQVIKRDKTTLSRMTRLNAGG